MSTFFATFSGMFLALWVYRITSERIETYRRFRDRPKCELCGEPAKGTFVSVDTHESVLRPRTIDLCEGHLQERIQLAQQQNGDD